MMKTVAVLRKPSNANVVTLGTMRLPIRDDSYFFADITFSVEDCLFKVPRYAFEQNSEAFAKIFLLPASESYQQPLQLTGILKEDFLIFLQVLYPKDCTRLPSLVKREWASVLKLATMWEFTDLRLLAIRSLAPMLDDPIEQIDLAKNCDVKEWLLPAMNKLAQREQPMGIEDTARLGVETVLKIGAVRECCSLRHYSRYGEVEHKRGARSEVDFTRRLADEFGLASQAVVHSKHKPY